MTHFINFLKRSYNLVLLKNIYRNLHLYTYMCILLRKYSNTLHNLMATQNTLN